MLTSSSKKLRSNGATKTGDFDCRFYWHRPIGAPVGTCRLTLEPAGRKQQKSYWALEHRWKDVCHVLVSDEDDNRSTSTTSHHLELDGDATVWSELPNWEHVCLCLAQRYATHRRRRLSSIRFLSDSCSGHQQRLLLESIDPQPQVVEFMYPKDYVALEALKNPLELRINFGRALNASDCSRLVRLLSKSRILVLRETEMADWEAWMMLFLAIEASSTLEDVRWDGGVRIEISRPMLDQSEPAMQYVEGRTRINVLRRVCMEQLDESYPTIGDRDTRNNHVRRRQRLAAVVDGATEVWREWWRSTHRPEIPPTHRNTSRAEQDCRQLQSTKRVACETFNSI